MIPEVLTQTLGHYPDSVFYQSWTATAEYSPLDLETIQLLYSHQLVPGMGPNELSSAFSAD